MGAALVIFAISILFELAPVAAAAWRRRALTRPLRLVAACFGLMFVQDVAGWWMAERDINNLWLSHVATPVQTLLLLFALAEWETSETGHRAVRFAGLGFLGAWGVLLLAVEDPLAFSRFTQPLQAILVVSVAAWTLVQRTARTFETPLAEPWFWVCSGLLLYFGTGVVLSPVANVLMHSAPDRLLMAHEAKAIINIVAYLLVARGMLCRLPSGSSGGSSSLQASSPSSSRRRSSALFSSSSGAS